MEIQHLGIETRRLGMEIRHVEMAIQHQGMSIQHLGMAIKQPLLLRKIRKEVGKSADYSSTSCDTACAKPGASRV